MNWLTTLYVALAAAAGSCIALQATANGRFRQNLTDDGAPWYAAPAWASYFSIIGTIVCATVAMLILRPPFPTKEAFAGTQWWNWIGGPLGRKLIVLAGATLTPILRPAPFICLVVGGQILCSMVLDHFGLTGTPQPVSLGKVFGAALVVAGVVCVKWL